MDIELPHMLQPKYNQMSVRLIQKIGYQGNLIPASNTPPLIFRESFCKTPLVGIL
jgi:hypothetical protein